MWIGEVLIDRPVADPTAPSIALVDLACLELLAVCFLALALPVMARPFRAAMQLAESGVGKPRASRSVAWSEWSCR